MCAEQDWNIADRDYNHNRSGGPTNLEGNKDGLMPGDAATSVQMGAGPGGREDLLEGNPVQTAFARHQLVCPTTFNRPGSSANSLEVIG